jgi:hypothetical protein
LQPCICRESYRTPPSWNGCVLVAQVLKLIAFTRARRAKGNSAAAPYLVPRYESVRQFIVLDSPRGAKIASGWLGFKDAF